ncbi:MAG: hypothetical protein ACK41E_11365, partial [Deinococcales bacterium]
MKKLLLVALVLFPPAAYAQNLCQNWSVPGSPQRPFSGLVFSSSAKIKGVEAFLGNTWQLLPSQSTAADTLEWLVPLADPQRGGQVRVRAIVSAQTQPNPNQLQICPERILSVQALPPSNPANNALRRIHLLWQQNLEQLKTALGAFGQYTLPERISPAELEQFPEPAQPIIALELLLRSQNNLLALSDGTAPVLDNLNSQQKALLGQVLESVALGSTKPLRLSPGRPLFSLPNAAKKLLPDLQPVLFGKTQGVASLFACSQSEMLAAQLRDCMLWQREFDSWNNQESAYKNDAYKILGALSLAGIVIPPLEVAATVAGLSVYLHQTMIEMMDGLLPSSLEPLRVNMPARALFEDVENAPNGLLPLRWQDPVLVSAKTKGYSLNALAIGDGILNTIGYGKLLAGTAKSARVFGQELGSSELAKDLGDIGAEALKATLAEAGL